MIDFKVKPIKGFDDELLLISEGYVARPVTLSKNTIAGLTPDDDGHYVIPQGTFLYGANGNSLLVDPQQEDKSKLLAEKIIEFYKKNIETLKTLPFLNVYD